MQRYGPTKRDSEADQGKRRRAERDLIWVRQHNQQGTGDGHAEEQREQAKESTE